MFIDPVFSKFVLPEDTKEALENSGWRIYPETKAQLTELCFGPTHTKTWLPGAYHTDHPSDRNWG